MFSILLYFLDIPLSTLSHCTTIRTTFGTTTHGCITQDPHTKYIYYFPNYNTQTIVYEWMNIDSFIIDSPFRTIQLEVSKCGTYHAVRNGELWYSGGNGKLIKVKI